MKPHLGTWLRAGLALLAVSFAGCDTPAPPGEPPYAVIHRVETAAGRNAETLKLGTHSRRSVALPAGVDFEVSLQGPVRGIVFSTATRAPSALRFSLHARGGSGWREIFELTQEPGEPAWRDHRVDEEQIPSGATRFRFVSESLDGDAGDEATAYWGGVAFLGDASGLRDAPNVVILSLDTLSAAHLSSFDNAPGVSGRIDAFLEQGFGFRRALAQYGNTLVSHASLFTGLYPRHHSLYPHSAFVPFTSLVSTLAEGGYLTAAYTEGAYVASDWGFWRGFDAYDDGAVGLSEQMAGGAERTFDRATRWLESHAALSRFFLFVHTYEVHVPYLVHEPGEEEIVLRITPDDARHLPIPFQMQGIVNHNNGRRPLSARDLAHLHALHSAEIHRLDGIVGRFLDRLGELGLADDTLVVLTSDHGDQFGEHGRVGHGNSLHNRVIHVPLGFRWPGRIEPGRSESPVQLVDVMPTILDLAGLVGSDALDGRSLAPLLRGESLASRPAFSEMLYPPGECRRLGMSDDCGIGRYSVQTERFKLVSSNIPRYDRLYDLEQDALETRDVSAEQPDELARHRALLERYLSPAPGERPAGNAAPVDPQTIRQLEALGYQQ